MGARYLKAFWEKLREAERIPVALHKGLALHSSFRGDLHPCPTGGLPKQFPGSAVITGRGSVGQRPHTATHQRSRCKVLDAFNGS